MLTPIKIPTSKSGTLFYDIIGVAVIDPINDELNRVENEIFDTIYDSIETPVYQTRSHQLIQAQLDEDTK